MRPHVSIFKYPLGFIRVVEFLFIVIAIAAVNSWSFSMTVQCPINSIDDSPPVSVRNETLIKSSTFTLSSVTAKSCRENKDVHFWTSENDAGGSAGFFYFVNVTALILVLITTFFYVIFWELYQENKRFALGDLAATVLFFILFFFCSSIWWAGSNTIGYSTGPEETQKLLESSDDFWHDTNHTIWNVNRNTNNGKLAISVLCDWVCVLCFAFNCWFIWKEIVPRDQEQPRTIG